MNFSINTRYLQEAITKCNTIIDSKHYNPQLREIHICVKKDNIEFRATKLKKDWVVYNCFCVASDEAEFTLQNTKELVKAIKYFEAENKGFGTDTEFEIVDKTCTITCADKKIKLQLLNDSEDSFPTLPQLDITDTNKYFCNVGELFDLVDKAKYAVAKDGSRPILQEIWFDRKNIVAMDGFRLVKITQDVITVERPFSIEAAFFDIVKKVFAKTDDIVIKDDSNNISIQGGNQTIVCQKIEGNFIEYDKIIDLSSTTVELTINVKDTIKQLKYLYDFTDNRYHKVVMFGKNLTAKNCGVEVEAQIEAHISGDQNLFEIAFSCKYMLETLQNIGSDTAIIKLAKANRPFYIESVGLNCDIITVILPIQICK